MKNIELHPFVFLYLIRLYMNSKCDVIEELTQIPTLRESDLTNSAYSEWLAKFRTNPPSAITESLSDKVGFVNQQLGEFALLEAEAKNLGYKLVKL